MNLLVVRGAAGVLGHERHRSVAAFVESMRLECEPMNQANRGKFDGKAF